MSHVHARPHTQSYNKRLVDAGAVDIRAKERGPESWTLAVRFRDGTFAIASAKSVDEATDSVLAMRTELHPQAADSIGESVLRLVGDPRQC